MRSTFALVLVAACSGAPAASMPRGTRAAPPTSTPTKDTDTVIPGIVLGPDGKPIAGAVVALVAPSASEATDIAVSDAAGRFALRGAAGDYGITATSASATAAYVDVSHYPAPGGGEVTIRLGADPGFTVDGHLQLSGDPPPTGARIAIYRASNFLADVFYTQTDAAAAFRVMLPANTSYGFALRDPQYIAEGAAVDLAGDHSLTLEATRLAPPPDDVVAWLAKAAAPLATAEPEHGFADLAPVKELVGKARVVALGEATHGTREFFQMKHRLLEYLVSELGFTVFAIEANWPEALAVDDYVVSGKGDAAAALAGLYFWTWNTQEVLDLIEWMRRWNADPKHKRKVHFYGFDIQYTAVALQQVLAYLARVDADYAKTATAGLKPFTDQTFLMSYQALSESDKKALGEAVTDVQARFTANRKKWTRATSEHDWRIAQHEARLLAQAQAMAGSAHATDERDAAMAENVRWILDGEAQGTRVMLWAHNAHVSRYQTAWNNLGKRLGETLGADYVSIGFVFAQGSFQALGSGGRAAGPQELTLEAPADSDVSTPFTRAGLSLALVDLRQAPKGVVADWLAALHPMRELGAVFDTTGAHGIPARLSRRFDAVLFVEQTSRARPNAPQAQ